jgi:thioredoxin-related protein
MVLAGALDFCPGALCAFWHIVQNVPKHKFKTITSSVNRVKKLLLILLLLQAVPVATYFHHESPIKWHEYNQETFELAEKENKPVFMLITASWCYWCHVYRDETLHQPEIYSYINENFVPVFVDADKRQDLTGNI